VRVQLTVRGLEAVSNWPPRIRECRDPVPGVTARWSPRFQTSPNGTSGPIHQGHFRRAIPQVGEPPPSSVPARPVPARDPSWDPSPGAERTRGVSSAEQASLSAVRSMSLRAVNCRGGAALTVHRNQLEDAGGTALWYDDSQFIQNWKTQRTPGCFLITIQAADSSMISAYFQVK
jgi:hypothetical protein